MLDSAGRGAENEVGKPPVSMGPHRHKVATFVVHPIDNRFHGIRAVTEFCDGGDARRLELRFHLVQIGAVLIDFPSGGLLAVKLGGGTGCHAQQNHLAVHDSGKLLDMFDDGPIGRRCVQSQEDLVIHLVSPTTSGRFMLPAHDDLPRGR